MHDYDQHEIKAVIGRCDFFIGSRMHSCIAALSQGIPTIGVAYSKKFEGVFDSIGMRNWVIDGRFNETEVAVDKTMDAILHGDEIKSLLQHKSLEVRTLLSSTFSRFFGSEKPVFA
jgi:colanic acid/amylovoran biosynthesis protein